MSSMNPTAFSAEDAVGARPKGTLMVILGGVATSFLALAAVWLLGQFVDDFNIMGWYAMYIVPAGALIVGMAAGLGYSLVSWLRGVKITGVLLWSVLALQALCYIEAQYLEYRALDPRFVDGKPMSFTTYFDLTTRSIMFSKRGGKQAGAPLGAWGYVFRGLELVGFTLGGLVPSLLLMSKPFCENCQVYMKTRSQGWVPASVAARKIKKGDTEGQQAYDAELKAALESGVAQMQLALEHATQADAAAFRAVLAPHKAGQKEIQKLPSRIEVQLSYCPRCWGGQAKAVCHTGHGEESTQQELGQCEVTPQFVQECLRTG